MTDHDDDVSRRYRELARDEPPAALDAAIVASARRAVAPRRTPWTRALSIAAVLVLAVGITLRMQHEEPGVETAAPEPARPAPAEPAPSTPQSTPDIAPSVTKRTESRAAQRAQKVAPPVAQRREVQNEAAPAPRKDKAAEDRPAPQAPPAAGASLPARVMAPGEKRAKALESAPAADARLEELERIAKLRAEGNDIEADAALAEFRRRNPDYGIPDAVWARVKPR